MSSVLNEKVAKKVLEVVDAGLVQGLGNPKPGEMCVEAAVCYALGLPHGDDPKCVSEAVRRLKIRLNDSNWSSNEARARGLRRLAVVQLGSLGAINDVEFATKVAEMTIRTVVPVALRAAAIRLPKQSESLEKAAARCEQEGTSAAADAADAVAYAAADAADAVAYAAAGAAYAADAAAYAVADAVAYAAAGAAYAAGAAAYAASASLLSTFAENVVQILISMNAPGAQWLYLTEEGK